MKALYPIVSTLIVLLTAFVGRAATYTVSNLNDNGFGSLRYYVSNSAAGDTIAFQNGLTGQIFSNDSGEIQIDHDLTIDGQGASLELFGYRNRVFKIQPGTSVTISRLVLRGAWGPGGLNSSSSVGGYALGGAIYNAGNLTINYCWFRNCNIFGGDGGVSGSLDGQQGGDSYGGAVYSLGSLVVNNSTFSGNYVFGGRGGMGTATLLNPGNDGGAGGNARGGAVYVAGTAVFANCTFSGNYSHGGTGGPGSTVNESLFPSHGGNGSDAAGGAIFVSGTSASMFNCTLNQNMCIRGDGGSNQPLTAQGSFGMTYGCGLQVDVGLATLLSNLIAGNTNDSASSSMLDVGGTVSSSGFNLVGVTNGSSGWIDSDILGSAASPINPKLGPLQDNGGGVPTKALLVGSPAIDGGASILSSDQRGFPRVDIPTIPNHSPGSGGDGSDIGAYELQVMSPVDIGLRASVGTNMVKLAAEVGLITSPLRMAKAGVTYGILLTSTNSPDSSKLRIKTASGIKSIQIMP